MFSVSEKWTHLNNNFKEFDTEMHNNITEMEENLQAQKETLLSQYNSFKSKIHWVRYTTKTYFPWGPTLKMHQLPNPKSEIHSHTQETKQYQCNTSNANLQSCHSDRKPFQHRQNTDIASHLIKVQDKKAIFSQNTTTKLHRYLSNL